MEYTVSDYAEDELLLRLGGEREFLMTRHNSTLFTFVGNLATRNHVFLEYEVDEKTRSGTYIFAHSNVFTELVGFMAEYDYPMVINHNEVPDCDEQAFQNSLDQLTGTIDSDHVPDDWQ